MNAAIELHDSELLRLERLPDDKALIILDAYVHRSEGERGVHVGQGGMQQVRIMLRSVCIEGEMGELPATIYEGTLLIDGISYDELIPLPLQINGNILLSITLFEDERTTQIAGRDLSITPDGEFRFIEIVDFSRS